MHFIKGILIVLSLLQYITQPSFWQNDFYWFFLWIIAFQVLWFYVEKSDYKKILLGILFLLAIINTVVLAHFPIMMFAIFAIDLRMELSRKTSTIILSGLLLMVAGIWTFLARWPTVDTLMIFIGVLTFSIWSVEQNFRLKERKERQYAYLLAQNELEEKAELLKAQMQSMEEVYTLNERNRISRDLHDSVGHTLSTIVIQLAAIEKITESTAPEASEMLNDLHMFTKKGLTNVREVIHELKPPKYNRIAFVEQLNHLIKEFENSHHIHVYFNRNEMQWPLNEDQKQLIFRAVQEFLVNTSKHSHATEIRIQYHFTDTSVILTMQDNGEGTHEINPQMGLTGMKERANLLGGKVSIHSSRNIGFKIRIVLPKGGFVDGTNTN